MVDTGLCGQKLGQFWGDAADRRVPASAIVAGHAPGFETGPPAAQATNEPRRLSHAACGRAILREKLSGRSSKMFSRPHAAEHRLVAP